MDKELDHELYNRKAYSLPNKGNFLCQKKIFYTRTLKLSVEESGYVYTEIGRISMASGQLQKSLVQLKKAIITDPDFSYAYVSLAEILLKLEKENEAFPILKKALRLDPGSFHPHHVLTTRLKERERLGDLDSFCQEIANLYTDTKSVADLYIGSAQALRGLNEHSKALEMYKKAFKAKPNAGYIYEYAFALYHGGEFEEARVQFEKLWQANPTSRIFANNLAFMTYCLGKLQEAFEEMEEIITNGLMSSGTYSNLILVLYHMGKDEELINHYRDLFQQNIGENGSSLRSMYEEALRITRVVLERDNIDEETRQFNMKKIEGINLVLSFIN